MVGLTSYTQASVTILTTELNALANNAYTAASAEQDNSTNHDLLADFELSVTFGTNPTVNSTMDLYIVIAMDGTVYGDGGGAVAPAPTYWRGCFPLRAVTTIQHIALEGVPLPPEKWKAIILNNTTGQALGATGHTLEFRSYKVG